MHKQVKNWTLPGAMIIGVSFHSWLTALSWLPPLLICCMLLLTFSTIRLRELRFTRLHWILVTVQVGGSLVVYTLCLPLGEVVAQGALICVLAPVATASPVITGMLGGNVAFMVSYCFLSNLAVAFAAPIIFSCIGPHSSMGFFDALLFICRQVMPLLLLPLMTAWAVQNYTPNIQAWMARRQSLSFYMWACSLTIVLGNACNFMLAQQQPDLRTEGMLALVALGLCIAQFAAGKQLGSLYQDRVSAGQAMGQKNTVLAIWMALAYINPLASLAPAAYIVWQNVFNAFQIWRFGRRK